MRRTVLHVLCHPNNRLVSRFNASKPCAYFIGAASAAPDTQVPAPHGSVFPPEFTVPAAAAARCSEYDVMTWFAVTAATHRGIEYPRGVVFANTVTGDEYGMEHPWFPMLRDQVRGNAASLTRRYTHLLLAQHADAAVDRDAAQAAATTAGTLRYAYCEHAGALDTRYAQLTHLVQLLCAEYHRVVECAGARASQR